MKIFEKILRLNKLYPTYAVVSLLCGVLCLALGKEGATLTMLITGALLLLYASLRIAGAFILEGGGSSALSLFVSVGVVLFGASIVASPEVTYASLPSLSGIYLVIEGGVGLFALSLYRSPTYVRLSGRNSLSRPMLATVAVLYALVLALGAILTFINAEYAYTLCAVALIASGIASVIASVLKNRPERTVGVDNGYIEADFTDKTDE